MFSKPNIYKLIEGFNHNVLTILRLDCRTNVILFQLLVIFAVRFPHQTVFISIDNKLLKDFFIYSYELTSEHFKKWNLALPYNFIFRCIDDAFARNDSKVNDYIIDIFRSDLEIKGITYTARYT